MRRYKKSFRIPVDLWIRQYYGHKTCYKKALRRHKIPQMRYHGECMKQLRTNKAPLFRIAKGYFWFKANYKK